MENVLPDADSEKYAVYVIADKEERGKEGRREQGRGRGMLVNFKKEALC